MNVVDTIKNEAGFYAELYYHEGASDPREHYEGHFLFLGFKSSRYIIGDEQIDHQMGCPCCDGEGEIESTDTDPDRPDGMTMCNLCLGAGEADSFEMLAAFLEHTYKPLHMRAVGMIDHSGVSYYLGGGASIFDPGGWDSGTCGFILYLQEHKDAWGCPDDADIDAQMAAEIQEYSDRANGEVYGVRIFDPNGDETDAECWGLVGEYAWEYAREELATYTAADIPEKLYAVPRMTRREINVIAHCLALFDGDASAAAESAFNKLTNIERSE